MQYKDVAVHFMGETAIARSWNCKHLSSNFVITLAIHKNTQSVITVVSIQQVVQRIFYGYPQIKCGRAGKSW